MPTNACWLFWPWLANSCFCLSFIALLRLNFPWRQRKLRAAEWTQIPPGVCISSFFCQGNVVQHLQRLLPHTQLPRHKPRPPGCSKKRGEGLIAPACFLLFCLFFYLGYCGGTLAHRAKCELCHLSGRAHRECSAEVCFTVYNCDYQKAGHWNPVPYILLKTVHSIQMVETDSLSPRREGSLFPCHYSSIGRWKYVIR